MTFTLTAVPTQAAGSAHRLHKVRTTDPRAVFTWLPYGTQHAWRAGTRRTLCGEVMAGWTVFWERAFSARETTACPGCVEMTLPEESRRRLDPRHQDARHQAGRELAARELVAEPVTHVARAS
jgi:hypothetical protein